MIQYSSGRVFGERCGTARSGELRATGISGHSCEQRGDLSSSADRGDPGTGLGRRNLCEPEIVLPGDAGYSAVDACSQVGTYREFVFGGGAGRRGRGTALRRLEGRNARAYSLLRAASGKGGDYGQRHRSGAGRDRDGDVESERATGEHSGGPIWIAGGSCAGRGHARPEWVHDWTDDQRQRRVVHELTD